MKLKLGTTTRHTELIHGGVRVLAHLSVFFIVVGTSVANRDGGFVLIVHMPEQCITGIPVPQCLCDGLLTTLMTRNRRLFVSRSSIHRWNISEPSLSMNHREKLRLLTNGASLSIDWFPAITFIRSCYGTERKSKSYILSLSERK